MELECLLSKTELRLYKVYFTSSDFRRENGKSRIKSDDYSNCHCVMGGVARIKSDDYSNCHCVMGGVE